MEAALNPKLNRRVARGRSPASRSAGRAADKHAGRRDAARGGSMPTMPRRPSELFQFWRACTEAQCSRARACRGESRACFDRHWPLLPEEAREWFRAAIRALSAGASPHDADAAGCAAAEAYRAEAAQAAPLPAGPGALTPAPAAPSPAEPETASHAPRLRTL
jgi:hypothetical protein